MSSTDGENLTVLLRAAAAGDSHACATLLPRVYQELRQLAAQRLASEARGQTLQATALVHEAYIRLVESGTEWSGLGHFFGAAARAMRQILVDRARARHAIKRGGDRVRSGEDVLQRVPSLDDSRHDELLALDEALSRLEARDPRKAQIVLLRYFAGLSIADTAAALDLSATTVKDEWTFARAWLQSELSDDE
ncbi:MAG: ECF-type sigma factor [Phycisphaerae bacterium]